MARQSQSKFKFVSSAQGSTFRLIIGNQQSIGPQQTDKTALQTKDLSYIFFLKKKKKKLCPTCWSTLKLIQTHHHWQSTLFFKAALLSLR